MPLVNGGKCGDGGWIAGMVSPVATIAVCLTGMVEYHQHRQAYF